MIELTLEALKIEAKNFCKFQENIKVPHLYGSTDGKAVGTYIEHEFKNILVKDTLFKMETLLKALTFLIIKY